MTKSYPPEYFENKIQQSQIKTAIVEALPTGVYYHNLIIALSELLKNFVEDSYQEEVFTKPVKQDKN